MFLIELSYALDKNSYLLHSLSHFLEIWLLARTRIRTPMQNRARPRCKGEAAAAASTIKGC
jgi:hypothetical protein